MVRYAIMLGLTKPEHFYDGSMALKFLALEALRERLKIAL